MLTVRKRARLPHWDVPSGSYFITVSLHDAIPIAERERVRLECDALRAQIERDHGRLTIAEEKAIKVVLQRKCERVLDVGHGSCWLRDQKLAKLVADAITFFDSQRYDLFAWCVMPNHFHAAFEIRAGWRIDSVIGSWKKYTARFGNQMLERRGTFWQEDYFDRTIRSYEHLQRAVRYIASNPGKAGLADWPFVKVYSERLWNSEQPFEVVRV